MTKAGVATEMLDLLSADPQELNAVVGRSQVSAARLQGEGGKDGRGGVRACS